MFHTRKKEEKREGEDKERRKGEKKGEGREKMRRRGVKRGKKEGNSEL